MTKKILLTIIILVVVIGGVVLLLSGNKRGESPAEGAPVSQEVPAPGFENVPEMTVNTGGAEIVYTDSGFSPNPLTVKQGETVTFVNQSSNSFWPASAMHPTHKVYPGSDIEKCGTAGESGIFDACRAISPGGEWSFIFNEVGSWNYHNHLNSSNFGKIIVE